MWGDSEGEKEVFVSPDFGPWYLQIIVRDSCIATCTVGHRRWWFIWPAYSSGGSVSCLNCYYFVRFLFCRTQWPRGLRRRSTAARLGLWVRIPPGAWMFVCCECCVLSGRGLCDELVTRPEESCRLWCVVVCDLETLMNEELYPINVIELNIGDTSLDVFPTCH